MDVRRGLMIDAVHERWMQVPADQRPKLMLYGESLGSMAGQGAFNWLPDIARMGFSSVLWVGPPNASPLWRADHRPARPGHARGSTALRQRPHRAVLPATDAAEIAADTEAPWEGTRVLFLQHASDPIVWWSEDLMFSRPDWLREPPGDDRTPLDALVSDRHVLAGGRRHDQCRRRCLAGTATTTANSCSTAGPRWHRPRAGPRTTPNASGSRSKRPRPMTGPSIDARQAVPGACGCCRSGRLERC